MNKFYVDDASYVWYFTFERTLLEFECKQLKEKIGLVCNLN